MSFFNDYCQTFSSFPTLFSDSCSLLGENNIYTAENVYIGTMQLGPSNPYQHYNLSLSNEEISALDNFRVEKKEVLRIFGALEGLESKIQSFIEGLSSKNANISSRIAHSITEQLSDIMAINKHSGDSLFAQLRAELPDANLDRTHFTPDIHVDGIIEIEKINPQNKYLSTEARYIFTIKGPSTLFFQTLSEDLRKEFILHDMAFGDHSSFFYNKLDMTDYTTAKFGQGTAFLAGMKNGAAHSVPLVDSERLVVIVDVRSNQRIKQLERVVSKEEDN